MVQNRKSTKSLVSWALYDWGNSAFAVTVMSGFFPIFFKQYWSTDTTATTSTFYLGLGNTIASALVALAAPLLGTIADQSGTDKRFIASFACIGCLMTASLFFVAQGQWPLAVSLYIVGVVCFSSANVFYDAMLLDVSSSRDRHRDSAIGYAFGYFGGGLLFLLNVVMTLKPHYFGLSSAQEAVRWSFITVAIWWAVFTLPLLFNVKAPQRQIQKKRMKFVALHSINSLANTVRQICQQKNIWLFLLAYWLYIDGVATIIKMGVDFGLSIGLRSNSLILALLIVQFVGFPATLVFGKLAGRSPRRSLWIILWVYVFGTVYAYFLSSEMEFYILAVILGLVQGAIQSISRSVFSQLIPAEKAAEYFGFQNMVGKAAAVFGPLLVGATAYLTGDSRLGFLSIIVLFIGGMLVLRQVTLPDELDETHESIHIRN